MAPEKKYRRMFELLRFIREETEALLYRCFKLQKYETVKKGSLHNLQLNRRKIAWSNFRVIDCLQLMLLIQNYIINFFICDKLIFGYFWSFVLIEYIIDNCALKIAEETNFMSNKLLFMNYCQ